MSEVDLSDTIMSKSDQLNAADIAGEMTIRIRDVKKEKGSEQPIHIYYDGDNGRPWKPCKSMRRVLAFAWGPKIDMTGRYVTLICDQSVMYAGKEVGGIRIKALSHINRDMSIPLRVNRTKVQKTVVKKIDADSISQNKTNISVYITAGNHASAEGVDAYKKWLESVPEDIKPTIKQYHKDWSIAAKKADEMKNRSDEEVSGLDDSGDVAPDL